MDARLKTQRCRVARFARRGCRAGYLKYVGAVGMLPVPNLGVGSLGLTKSPKVLLRTIETEFGIVTDKRKRLIASCIICITVNGV